MEVFGHPCDRKRSCGLIKKNDKEGEYVYVRLYNMRPTKWSVLF